MNEALKRDLTELLGARAVIDAPDRCNAFAGDWSGLKPQQPSLVLRPGSARDAAAAVQLLYRVGVPMTFRGTGTGKAGGCIPSKGSVVLTTEGMNAPAQVQPLDLTLCAPAGLIAARLDEAAHEHQLFYPPDPNSLAISSIGGNVATNAGGPRAVKYGLTGHYLLGLTFIDAQGELIHTGARTIKSVAGTNLTGLLLGSEGTLGLITDVTMRLIARPQAVQTALVTFADSAAAVDAVGALFATGIMPRTAELLDEVSCDTLRRQPTHALPADCGAALILETDGSEEQALDELATLAAACEEHGATSVLVAQTPKDRERVWAPRRDLSVALGDRRSFKVSEDIAVPRGRLSDLVQALRKVASSTPFEVATYGHAGDGNLHVNILFDDEHQRPDVEALQDEVFRTALDLGGTITGEHGVGLAKKHALKWEASPARLATETAIKNAMDPKDLFNPGKVL